MANKILYVTSVASHWGSEQSLLNLLKHLDRQRYSPFLLSVNGSFLQKLEENQIPYKTFFSYTLTKKHIVKFAHLVCWLAWFTKQNKFALVHSNDIHSAQYSLLAARAARVPSVLHIRNIALERWLGWKNRAIFICASRTIAISKETQRSLLKIGLNPDKIHIIPNAVDLNEFTEEVSGTMFRQEAGADKTKILIGVVGRITPHKGQHIFAQAIPHILNSFPNSKFVIVGEDTTPNAHFKKDVQKILVDLGIPNVVHFTGFRRNVPEIMKALDLLVVPSLSEPFGRVVIEAMAMKTPVVATDSGGTSDIIQHGINGLLVPIDNPAAIANAVVRLLSDKNYYTMISNNSRRSVEKYYSVPLHIERIQEIYDSLLKL